MTKLRLSPDLALPVEAVTEKLAFLGRTGSGKTYAAQKLAEAMHAAGAQFVVLDPVGVWWGLRLLADGKRPGLEVPVLGGLHGDIPLEAGAGALIANLVVDRGIPVVLDVSQFESDTDKARFAQSFADRFFFRKKAAPSAVHLFIEEAQEFVPQNPQREEARMLHAFTRLLKIGRNFGIGASLISQRPQEVNKKVLNLAEVLFAFQMTGPHERKTIQGWIAEKGIEEDIAGELPKLARGAPHVWSPAWLKISKRVAIATKITFDASSTPVVGKKADARPLAPIDLDHLRAEMVATIEKAKAEDPRELRRRIAELERGLTAKKENVSSPPPKRVEVPVFQDRQLQRVEKILGQFHGIANRFGLIANKASGLEESAKAFAQEVSAALKVFQAAPATLVPPLQGRVLTSRTSSRPVTSRAHQGILPKGEHRLLTAIAQHLDGVTREQLSVLTGYKRSSRDTYLQRCRERGVITFIGERFLATDAGLRVLGPSFEPLPTGPALREHWLAHLPEGERRILALLIDAYPKAINRDRISEMTDYKRSSRDTYLQRLSARQLIVTEGRGQVKASEELF